MPHLEDNSLAVKPSNKIIKKLAIIYFITNIIYVEVFILA